MTNNESVGSFQTVPCSGWKETERDETSKAGFALRWEEHRTVQVDVHSGILATGECLLCAEHNKVVKQIRKENRMRTIKPEPQRACFESGEIALMSHRETANSLLCKTGARLC